MIAASVSRTSIRAFPHQTPHVGKERENNIVAFGGRPRLQCMLALAAFASLQWFNRNRLPEAVRALSGCTARYRTAAAAILLLPHPLSLRSADDSIELALRSHHQGTYKKILY